MKGDIAIDKLMLKIEEHHYNRCYEEVSRWFEEQKKLWKKGKKNDENIT